MAGPLGDPCAPPRPRARALGDRPPRAATAPIVLVMRGYERFVSGRGGGSFARASVGRFPNGELHLELPECMDGRRCVLVGSISPPAGNLERLTLVAHALRRAGAERVTAVLPYLAYARQDRAARAESLGLAWVGQLLRASGVGEVVCVDVHSEQAAEVLGLSLTAAARAVTAPATARSPVRSTSVGSGRCCSTC